MNFGKKRELNKSVDFTFKKEKLGLDSKKQNSKKTFEKEGIVLEALPNTLFRVKLNEGKEVLAQLAGRLRMYRIRILPGDRVKVEMTPYDEKRGRIVYRLK